MPAVMILARLASLAVAMLCLVACSASDPVAPTAEGFASPLPLTDEGAVVARVNGVAIPQIWLDTMARGRDLDLADPAQRMRALDELVEYAVLAQAARNQPDLADGAARAEIELNAISARASGIMARVGASAEPDEAALKAEYDAQTRLNGDSEYDVSHLLFADQAEALEATAAAPGKPFSELQASYKDRARQSVDLGWIKLGQVPPEFASALGMLEPGSTTAAPVQTTYGWHVIHLRAKRPFTFPAFDDVREGIRRMLVAKATREAVEALKEKANIEIVAQ
jgi:peptidyl-prolyl cis-trans isomerase C